MEVVRIDPRTELHDGVLNFRALLGFFFRGLL